MTTSSPETEKKGDKDKYIKRSNEFVSLIRFK